MQSAEVRERTKTRKHLKVFRDSRKSLTFAVKKIKIRTENNFGNLSSEGRGVEKLHHQQWFNVRRQEKSKLKRSKANLSVLVAWALRLSSTFYAKQKKYGNKNAIKDFSRIPPRTFSGSLRSYVVAFVRVLFHRDGKYKAWGALDMSFEWSNIEVWRSQTSSYLSCYQLVVGEFLITSELVAPFISWHFLFMFE